STTWPQHWLRLAELNLASAGHGFALLPNPAIASVPTRKWPSEVAPLGRTGVAPCRRSLTIFARDGLRLPRQTLCDWTLGAAEALRPLADCLMARTRAGPVMQLDDTPVQCQGGRGEKNFQAYL